MIFFSIHSLDRDKPGQIYPRNNLRRLPQQYSTNRHTAREIPVWPHWIFQFKRRFWYINISAIIINTKKFDYNKKITFEIQMQTYFYTVLLFWICDLYYNWIKLQILKLLEILALFCYIKNVKQLGLVGDGI